jgi:hypothetical protein
VLVQQGASAAEAMRRQAEALTALVATFTLETTPVAAPKKAVAMQVVAKKAPAQLASA